MSCQQLPHSSYTSGKRPNFFYKPDQIRFKGFASQSFKRIPRQEYIVQTNPWTSLKDDQIRKLIDRLQDRPQQLYQTIQKRKKRTKFTLLNSHSSTQNSKFLNRLQTKKRRFEQQFRTILQQRKQPTLNILLPKLDSVRYVFRDNLHALNSQCEKAQ